MILRKRNENKFVNVVKTEMQSLGTIKIVFAVEVKRAKKD